MSEHLVALFLVVLGYLALGGTFWRVVVYRQIREDAAHGDEYAAQHLHDAHRGQFALWVVSATVVVLWPLALLFGIAVSAATRCMAREEEARARHSAPRPASR